MISHIRLSSQQLGKPEFNDAKELVSWMGAIQGQDYVMSKWAIGLRLKEGTLSQVEKAINDGEIIRTHVLRPTWHLVPGEDLRWMLALSAKRNKSAFESYGKHIQIPEGAFLTCRKHIEQLLRDNNHLTKQELISAIQEKGMELDPNYIHWFITRTEIEGIICSGADKKGKPTYALLDERVPHSKELSKEEALALLATRYFQSHSPATLEDFTWWSGLGIREARQAIASIKEILVEEKYGDCNFYIHQSYAEPKKHTDIFHLLPSYDEYLISYKDRTHVLKKEHYPYAFNNYGIFHPVILHNGKIIGNWKKNKKKGEIQIEDSYFISTKVNKKLLQKSIARYTSFLEVK